MIELLFVIIALVGFMLPNRLLKYHVITCILLMVFHELLNKKNIFSLVVKKVGDYDKYHQLIPMSSSHTKTITVLLMFLSIFGLIVPKLSVFSILNKIFIFLKKWN